MLTRKSIGYDTFYPGKRDQCIVEIETCLHEAAVKGPLPDDMIGGIVPHAGWIFSGSLAAMVFSALKQQYDKVDVFIVLGAAHNYFGKTAAVSPETYWETPLGKIEISKDLTKSLLETGLTSDNSSVHRSEHSIEVQIPFIQYLFPNASICPVIVPPSYQAISLGEVLYRIIKKQSHRILCIGSTDLTHYGPRYGFTPMGTGSQGVEWAAYINDKRFVDLALEINPEGLLAEAAENGNACGPGAAAAIVSLAKQYGKTRGKLLGMTNSNKVMQEKMGTTSLDSVGYAAIVF